MSTRTYAKRFAEGTIFLYDGTPVNPANRAHQIYGPSMVKGTIRLMHADGTIDPSKANMPAGIYTDVTDLNTYDEMVAAMTTNEALVGAQRSAITDERAALRKEREIEAMERLMATGRGWYHVEVRCAVDDLKRGAHKDMTFSGQVLADSGLAAYNRACEEIKKSGGYWPEELTAAQVMYLGTMTDDIREYFATA